MTVQLTTVEAMTQYYKTMHYYIERVSDWPRVVPTQVIPEHRYVEFYRYPKTSPPKDGLSWGTYSLGEAVTEKYPVMVPSTKEAFSYAYEDVRTTAAYGMPILNAQTTIATKQLAKKMAYWIYQGSTDLGSPKGLTNIASPTGQNTSAYVAIKWNAAYGPQNTIRDMAGSLETDGFDAPFAFVMGNGMQTGFWTTVTSTAEYNVKQVNEILTSPGSIAIGTSMATIVIESQGASSGNDLNPLPAAGAGNNVALLLKPATEHFSALIARPPFIEIDPSPSIPADTITGAVGAMATIIVPQPTAICYHDRITYA